MTWHQNAVFYELYPRAFADGNGDGYGDLMGLRQRLEYLEWLGIDCIWLTPIYPSPMRDDGYDVESYYGLHPMYGQLEDFKMTVEEVHRRGMKIVLDLVVNHISDQHPWFKEARSSKESVMRDWFVWSDTTEKYNDTRIIFLDTERSNWAYDEQTSEYYWHRFYSSQPDLNYENPRVRQEMIDVMRFWLDMGIDGFRVDAVPYLIEKEGSNCENLPETHEILQEWRAFVDKHYPGRVLLAEANQWPQDLMPYFGTASKPEFHMCFHFPVMPRLYMALARGDRQCVVDILAATPTIPPGTQWGTFLRNHDELTLEMVTPEEREEMWDFYAPEPRMRLNMGIRRRLAPLMDNDRRKIELMNSMLFTLPGAPVIYYGDEIGMGDNISLEDRNGVRTPMQWNSDIGAGFSVLPASHHYTPAIQDETYGYTSVNVESQRADPNSLLNTIRRMVWSRKALPVLGKGTLNWMENLPKQALCFWRTDSRHRFLALHNLSDAPLEISLPEGETFIDELSDSKDTLSDTVTLPPYGYRWLLAQ